MDIDIYLSPPVPGFKLKLQSQIKYVVTPIHTSIFHNNGFRVYFYFV